MSQQSAELIIRKSRTTISGRTVSQSDQTSEINGDEMINPVPVGKQKRDTLRIMIIS